MVHVRDIYQVHFCSDRHVSALICWICNENLCCISYGATGLCPYVHGNSVHVGYFHRRILYDMHHKSSLDLPSNNSFSCDEPIHPVWYKNMDICHNKNLVGS